MERSGYGRKAWGVMLMVFVLALGACAPRQAAEEPPPVAPPSLTQEEREARALEAFDAVVELTRGVPKHTVLRELEEGYLRIITDYPGTQFAEESYLYLFKMYLFDYPEPRVAEAERFYSEYVREYPEGFLKHTFNDTMIRFYYDQRHWDRLVYFLDPYIKQYVETGELKYPLYLFFYSDAKFNMGNWEEAMKGYRALMDEFPASYEAKISKARLEVITKGIDQIKKKK